jgi:two-component system phosphate regulon response regulator PhoB
LERDQLTTSRHTEFTHLLRASLAFHVIKGNAMRRVLIIDDEADALDLVSLSLRKEGQFTVSSAIDGTIGLRKARQESPSLIILDLLLPGISGFEICRILKGDDATRAIPILVLSAMAGADDRVRGLELGADDYVTKPFSPRELILRVNALARSNNQVVTDKLEWRDDNLAVSGSRHEVSVGGRRVCLTAVEFKLLTYLIQTRGRVQSRDSLLEQVWNYESSMTTRTVDAHIQRLRKKLRKAGDVIETVRSYGYQFRN